MRKVLFCVFSLLLVFNALPSFGSHYMSAGIKETLTPVLDDKTFVRVFKFKQTGRVINPNDKKLVVDTKPESLLASTFINMDALQTSPTFLSYIYRGKILKIDVQYYTPSTDILDSSNIVSYIIYPIVYKDRQLIGFMIIETTNNRDISEINEVVSPLVTPISEYLYKVE